jgi:hypothetical protein
VLDIVDENGKEYPIKMYNSIQTHHNKPVLGGRRKMDAA